MTDIASSSTASANDCGPTGGPELSQAMQRLLLHAKFNSFVEHVTKKPKQYATWCRYRQKLLECLRRPKEYSASEQRQLKKKLKFVETQMQKLINEGLKTKRRIPNTGERVVLQEAYKDTPSNRKLDRVGQTYEKVVYKDAQYEDATRSKMRKRKRQATGGENGPKKNKWITCVMEAKRELGGPNFVIVRKQIKDNKDDDQVLGHKIYLRAKELMDNTKFLKEQGF